MDEIATSTAMPAELKRSWRHKNTIRALVNAKSDTERRFIAALDTLLEERDRGALDHVLHWQWSAKDLARLFPEVGLLRGNCVTGQLKAAVVRLNRPEVSFERTMHYVERVYAKGEPRGLWTEGVAVAKIAAKSKG